MKWYVVEVKHDGPILETSVLLGPFKSRKLAVAGLAGYFDDCFANEPDVSFDRKMARIWMDEGQFKRTILVAKGYNDEA